MKEVTAKFITNFNLPKILTYIGHSEKVLLMKKFLLSIVIGILFCNIGFAIEYETSSKFWNSKTDGPTTIDGAIKRFFINNRLDSIEGIWLDAGYGWFAIKKNKDGSYKKWQIKSTSPALDGSIESTIYKTDEEKIFSGKVRIEWPDPDNENWFVFATSNFTINMHDINLIDYKIERYAAEPESYMIRIWPLDFNEYNKEFY